MDRWAKARKADPGLDEQRWRATTAAIARPGLVSLRGLLPSLITEILFGLQQRCAAERRTSHKMLRTICDDMRRQQVATIADFAPGNVQRPVVGSFLMHLRRAAATTETEKADDVWDLALFGHGGRMSFTAITQGWLRDTAKRWVLGASQNRRCQPSIAAPRLAQHPGHSLRRRTRAFRRAGLTRLPSGVPE